MTEGKFKKCHAQFTCQDQNDYFMRAQAILIDKSKSLTKKSKCKWRGLCNQQWNDNTIEADLVRKGSIKYE